MARIFFTLIMLSLSIMIAQSYLLLNKIKSPHHLIYSSSSSTNNQELSGLNVLIDKPKWAAGGILSDFVNALINFKPLFSIMKIGARNTLINTAEKNNIPWRKLAEDLETKLDLLTNNYNNIVNKNIKEYPSYYEQEFHAYKDGNLNWDAAFECESATMSMAIRTWPKESLTVKEAQDRLRSSFTDTIKDYIESYSSIEVNKALDVGCSVGVSTFYLSDAFPNAKKIDGLDLSPYFLSIAKGRQDTQCGLDVMMKENNDILRINNKKYSHINWIHANIEESNLADNSYDLIACSFVFHELPTEAANNILKELYRIVKPGGVVAITDINPGSPVIQNLPPALFTLMKSTEPWSDQYYCFDIQQAMSNIGFQDTTSKPTDPRHHTILGLKTV